MVLASVSGTDLINQLAGSFRMGTTMVCFANVRAFVFVASTHGASFGARLLPASHSRHPPKGNVP
jgi:hypothetical protein